MGLVKHSYKEDCIFLLKDLSKELEEITIEEKEEIIRSGRSYSEVISKEEIPSNEAMCIFEEMIESCGDEIAHYIAKVSQAIYKTKGNNTVLVSLARGGTPYGILIRKYLKIKYNVSIPHYSISIIRGKGIDYNALKYIIKKHEGCNIQFIDGWTGKGSIIKELNQSISKFNLENECEIDSSLAVIADPAKLCSIYGTREDLVIPSCCLNGTVSGLISRTVLNSNFIGEDDFHGAKYLDYLEKYDISDKYIKCIAEKFSLEEIENENTDRIDNRYAENIVNDIKNKYNMKSINSIKLSIGESARVLLRRKPKMILVKSLEDPQLKHIIYLAKERNVEIVIYSNSSYKSIALIDEEK